MSTRNDERALWIGLTLAFLPALAGLARQWAAIAYYSHGFLVPLVSAAVALPRLRQLGPSRRRRAGLGGVAAALALYALGLGTGSPALQGLALVACLCGLVGFRWGEPGLRRLAFPLAYLLFMIPLPASWLAPLIVGLQRVVTAAAIGVLHGLGTPVLRQGNVMELSGGGALFVDEACSGITSLVTLVPLGVLLAYFTERSGGRRALIVASVVPAAFLGNFLRVVVTVLAASALGVERATSSVLHELAGLLTFVFACGLVIGFGALLRSGGHARRAAGSAVA